jgi:hypothetical protein
MKKPTKAPVADELPPGTYRRGWKAREQIALQKVKARVDAFDKNRIRAEHIAKMDAERLAAAEPEMPPIPLRTKLLSEIEAEAPKAEKKAKPAKDPKPAETVVADEEGEAAIATVNTKD